MGLADRDYMRSPTRHRDRITRLNNAPTEGVILEARAIRSPAAKWPPRRRQMCVLALWLAGGAAVFTILWAIACAIIGAQWHGQGTTFTPTTAQNKAQVGGSNHGAR